MILVLGTSLAIAAFYFLRFHYDFIHAFLLALKIKGPRALPIIGNGILKICIFEIDSLLMIYYISHDLTIKDYFSLIKRRPVIKFSFKWICCRSNLSNIKLLFHFIYEC